MWVLQMWQKLITIYARGYGDVHWGEIFNLCWHKHGEYGRICTKSSIITTNYAFASLMRSTKKSTYVIHAGLEESRH